MKKLSITIGIAVFLSVISGYAWDIKSQKYRFNSSFTIKEISNDAKKIEFWIPCPLGNQYQSVIKADYDVAGTYSFVTDNKYNNKILHGVCENDGKGFLKINATYEIIRKEWLTGKIMNPGPDKETYPPEVLKYLESSNFAVITPRIKELANKITADSKTMRDKAYAIYDYVISNMEYNKADPGWGKGDSERACFILKGNCTDFHSMFNSLARAVNIPAKFVIGFPVPKKINAEIRGYHCWAAFYLNNQGWVPVDTSEAWKNKSKKEYYFGNLDENRIGFTVGRDIILDAKKDRIPLNYFIYPYVEIDGKATANIEMSFKSKLL